MLIKPLISRANRPSFYVGLSGDENFTDGQLARIAWDRTGLRYHHKTDRWSINGPLSSDSIEFSVVRTDGGALITIFLEEDE